MTTGLVNGSFSLPKWQAVKMVFFAPWTTSLFSLCSINNLPTFFEISGLVHLDGNFQLNFVSSSTFWCHNIIQFWKLRTARCWLYYYLAEIINNNIMSWATSQTCTYSLILAWNVTLLLRPHWRCQCRW